MNEPACGSSSEPPATDGVGSKMDLEEKMEASKQLADRYEKLLLEERSYRQELEKVFEKKSKQAENATFNLNEQIQGLERLLDNAHQRFNTELRTIEAKFQDLLEVNRHQQIVYDTQSKKYQSLMGYFRKTATQMRDDNISLPQTTEELQFECLKLREELIEAKAGKEHIEEETAGTIEALSSELEQSRALSSTLVRVGEVDELKQTIHDLEQRLSMSQAETNALGKSLDEYRQRCTQLQIELDNSEAVQKDFVKLSQSLQIQLEKIRSTEQEVRWQFLEDVVKCNGCETDLKKSVKGHCMHCGKVFCQSCVANRIATGPQNRQASVCSVCYTLLNRNSAPFFSKPFAQSP